MANHDKAPKRAQRARPTPQRRRRRAEHIALAANARCGPRRRRTRQLALLLFAVLVVGIVVIEAPALADDPAPGSAYWKTNAPVAHADPQRSGHIDIDLLDPLSDLLWQSEGETPLMAGPVMDEYRVYSVDRDGFVTARWLTNGAVAWTHDLDEKVAATPALAYGWLYIATLDGNLHSLERQTGKPMEEAELSGPARAATLVTQARVYQGTDEGILHVLDATTLKQLWEFNTDTVSINNGTATKNDDLNAPIRAPPAVHDGRVYLASWNGYVYSMSITGDPKENPETLHWSRDVGDIVNAPPVVDRHRDRVLVPTQDGRLQSLHLSNGNVAWQTDATNAHIVGTAVDAEQILVLTSDAGLKSHNATNGAHQWTHHNPSGHIAGPALTNDAIVVVSGNGTVDLLAPSTGLLLDHPDTDDNLARWKLPGATHKTPAVTRNGIAIADHSGSLTLIGPTPQLEADLEAFAISVVSMPIGPRVGLEFTVKNHGPDLAPDIQLRIDRNGNLHKESMLGPLEPGQEKTHEFLFESAPGPHELDVIFRAIQATDPDPQRARTSDRFVLDEEPELENNTQENEDPVAAGASPSFTQSLGAGLAWAAIPGGLAGLAGGVTLARRMRTPGGPTPAAG